MSITELSPTFSRSDELLPEPMVKKLFEEMTSDPSKKSQRALLYEVVASNDDAQWAYLNLRPVIQRYLCEDENNTDEQNYFVGKLLSQSTITLDKNNYTEYYSDAFEASQLIAAFEAVSYPEDYERESDMLKMLTEVPLNPRKTS